MGNFAGKRKKAIFSAVLSFLLLFTGCGSGTAEKKSSGNDLTVRISMYNDIAYSGWRTYVEKQCPDITFIWENNRNSTQNLIYQAKHGDMADLVTIRRFESDSAAELAPYLMDLKDEDLTSAFTEDALLPFTFDGKLCWYPAPGMIESFYANASMFERNGIQIPETRKELTEACRRFKSLGINGVSIETGAGYRAAYLLESFGYAGYFGRPEGEAWLKKLWNGKTEALPEDGCRVLYSAMKDLTDSCVLDQEDLDKTETVSEFDSEKTAMVCLGTDLDYAGKAENKYSIIPCLGDTKEDQILYTYPIFNTAVSKEAAADPEKKKAVERILRVMYSSEAQQILSKNADALMSYNKGIDLPIGKFSQSVAELIREKKCFIRFLNKNMFAASVAAVKAVISGPALTEEDFSRIFNDALCKEADSKTIGKSSIDADNRLGDQNPLERPAASVLAQTVRAAAAADAVIIEGKCAAAPIYKGDYAEKDLNAVIAEEKLYEAELTGEELQAVFDSTILATTTYKYLSLEPLVDYPALSGMRAALSYDGKSNTLFLPDGKKPASGTVYKVVISDTIKNALSYLANKSADSFKPTDKTLQSSFRKALAEGALPEPEKYFEVGASR